MKVDIFHSNSLLQFKVVLILFVFYMLVFFTACPRNPRAQIKITVSNNPILMEWSWLEELWYLRTTVTVSETAGVGVNAEYIKLEFPSPMGNVYAEPQLADLAGGRVDAFKSVTINIEIEFNNSISQKVLFSISGTDDYGNDINAFLEVPLNYSATRTD
jgi:hypothetical protein